MFGTLYALNKHKQIVVLVLVVHDEYSDLGPQST